MLRLRASRPASIAVRRPASQCYQPTCYSCRTASISVFIASSLSSRIQGDFAQRAKRQLFRRTIPSSSPHSTLHLNVPYILAESDSVLRAKKLLFRYTFPNLLLILPPRQKVISHHQSPNLHLNVLAPTYSSRTWFYHRRHKTTISPYSPTTKSPTSSSFLPLVFFLVPAFILFFPLHFPWLREAKVCKPCHVFRDRAKLIRLKPFSWLYEAPIQVAMVAGLN